MSINGPNNFNMMRGCIFPGYTQGGYIPRGVNRGNIQVFTSGVVDNKANTWYGIGSLVNYGINDLAKGDDSLIGKAKKGIEWLIGLFKK